jgi:hypothetical protein
VVLPAPHERHFLDPILPDVCEPQVAIGGIKTEAPGIAEAGGPDLGRDAGLADEWIIAAPENVGDAVALAHTLSAKGWPSEASADGIVRVAATAASSAAINRAAAGDGITLAGLTAERQPLEEIFLSMTGEDL